MSNTRLFLCRPDYEQTARLAEDPDFYTVPYEDEDYVEAVALVYRTARELDRWLTQAYEATVVGFPPPAPPEAVLRTAYAYKKEFPDEFKPKRGRPPKKRRPTLS